ncbi:MAG: HPP family protein [Planctomycetota bacterium]
MQQRLVRDLMRIRHGHVVPETASLREVAERLIISDCDIMAVTDASGKLSGSVCETSVVRALMSNPAETATIQSIVARHSESVRLDASVGSVLPLFRSAANTAIPVIDDAGRVCGLLMRRDVIGNLLQRRFDSAESTASESAPTALSSSVDEFISSVVEESRLPAGFQRSFPGGRANGENKSDLSKPHFLRADDARRVLWSAEDRL